MGRLKLFVSAAAGRDLDTIFDHSTANWGIEQASRYVGSFDPVYENLLDYPELGSVVDKTSGYRRLRHHSHLIFYRVVSGKLRIERILHYRMDALRHLR